MRRRHMNFQATSKLAGGSFEETMNCAPATAKGASYTMEVVAKHAMKGDVWVVAHGRVPNVLNFLSQHPGGELDILIFAGKDASAVFDLIYPSDVHRKVRARCSHRHTWDKWWIRFCFRVQCVSSRAKNSSPSPMLLRGRIFLGAKFPLVISPQTWARNYSAHEVHPFE